MALNTVTWTNKTRLIHIGDSVTGPFSTATSPFLVAYPTIAAKFGLPAIPNALSPFLPPVYKRPVLGGIDGPAGRECKTIGVDAATFLTFTKNYNGPFTHAVVQLGINDAAAILAATTTPAVCSASQIFILDGLNSIFGIPYSNIMWIGPWQRPADLSVQVPQVDGIFIANSLTFNASGVQRNFCYVPWSGLLSSGGLSIGDQTHPSATGAALLATPVVSAVNLA
jgi:hypothetical protein